MTISNHQAITSIHIDAAQALAFRLLMLASTVFPPPWTRAPVPRLALVDATEFALHARRVIELCGLRAANFPMETPVTLRRDDGGTAPEMLTDLHECLNRFHHARDVQIIFVKSGDRTIYTAHDFNMVASYISLRTDRLPTALVSIFGLAHAFLIGVLPAVQAKFPGYLGSGEIDQPSGVPER